MHRQHRYVPTKTISIGEEAYRRLKKLRRPGESFTDVILRLSGRGDLTRFAGTIAPDVAALFDRTSTDIRARADQEFRERVR